MYSIGCTISYFAVSGYYHYLDRTRILYDGRYNIIKMPSIQKECYFHYDYNNMYNKQGV